MDTDRLAARLGKLRIKVAKAECDLRLLRLKLDRVAQQYQFAVDSCRVAAGKGR